MPARFWVHCLPLALASLTIPAAFGFYFYGSFRAWTFMPEPRGVPSAILVLAIVPGIFAGLWLWCIVELCRASHASLLRRRARRGRCWRCNYSQQGVTAARCCECGEHPSAPPAYRPISAHTIAMVGGLALVAIMPGALLAEWHITAEDQRFIAHVQSMNGQHNAYRDRAWPYQGFGLVYLPGHGFSIND
ncbi:MAG: hypothetical protein NCW75_07560 [Phycisphaera sp.]|nr:MAG: hypothetical protein NCW75_07560 [Phycisphaera sp.]